MSVVISSSRSFDRDLTLTDLYCESLCTCNIMENVSDWTVDDVKEWAKEHYGEDISEKFQSKLHA